MSHEDAARRVVQALRDLGRVEQVDEGLLAAYVGLAAELDDETKDRAGLYREFRAYDVIVRALGGEAADGVHLDDLLNALAESEVGNTPPAGASD